MNYSEHGTVVDGILFSCDFSRKSPSDRPPPSANQDVLLTLDDLSSLGKGRRASQARARLEAARKSLRDKEKAKRVLEAALRLSAPVKDDFSLAEEMSKCEGLMTRTGLKRVAATENIASSGNSSVVLSIPFSRTKKSDIKKLETVSNNLAKKGTSAKGQTTAVPGESVQKTIEPNREKVKSALAKQEVKMELDKTNSRGELQVAVTSAPQVNSVSSSGENSTGTLSAEDKGQIPLEEKVTPPSVPCGCRKSLSSVVGSNGKGWEGTATLYHGSRLRFGCLQFILSLAGRPGHSELIQALTDQLDPTRNNNDL